MAANFIHRILRSLKGTTSPPVADPRPIVDNPLDQPLLRPQSDRRLDVRFAVRSPCNYELLEGRGQDATTIEGKAYSLNVSAEGILLLLDRKPQDRQLVAIHNPALQRQQPAALFEVRWAARFPVGTTQERYVVGCHLTFGRFPYFLVQRHHFDQHISGLSL